MEEFTQRHIKHRFAAKKMYLYRERKKKYKYHIAVLGGTACNMQNGYSFQKLDACSEEPPPGRKLCSLCEQAQCKKPVTIPCGKKFNPTPKKPNNKNPSNKEFYQSWEWKTLRYKVLLYYGAVCMLCGSTYRIVVDHIKPRKKYPELELDFDNMQVLCDECNRGKGQWDETDHRPDLTDSQVVELSIVREARERQ